MRSFVAVAAAIALGFCTIAASAMPVDLSIGRDDNAVAQVRYGCGPGMTRGPADHCRPRFTCPPGWHPGPYGWHCFRNRW